MLSRWRRQKEEKKKPSARIKEEPGDRLGKQEQEQAPQPQPSIAPIMQEEGNDTGDKKRPLLPSPSGKGKIKQEPPVKKEEKENRPAAEKTTSRYGRKRAKCDDKGM